MSQYQLAVADILQVPISFRTKDGAKVTTFKFTLDMQRCPEEDWNTSITDEFGTAKHEKIKAKLKDLTIGWRDQTFVQDGDKVPAPFCQEALEVMFSAVGIADVVLKAFMKENAATAKN
jgi:2-hydroxy-3-keto-5-methylthiopentenyl-1-phosphate phosphatase